MLHDYLDQNSKFSSRYNLAKYLFTHWIDKTYAFLEGKLHFGKFIAPLSIQSECVMLWNDNWCD